MSAWYILSAMGLYQVDPAGGIFVIGSPVLKKTTLALPLGKTFTISTVGNSDKNIYVQKAEWKGKPYRKSYIHYSDIMQGGELVLYMGDKPSKDWGIEHGHRPYSSLYVQPPQID
jgi:putative alpha-1,2-mannosidase